MKHKRYTIILIAVVLSLFLTAALPPEDTKAPSISRGSIHSSIVQPTPIVDDAPPVQMCVASSIVYPATETEAPQETPCNDPAGYPAP